ncbi:MULTISPECIES: TetR/AcrR family transcriptional regulator [Chitinophagaceae]
MGRKSLKELRQKEIIKAFYKMAKKEGLENASIAKTATAMDINPSLILHYFQTKEQLIYGLVEFILDKYLLIFKINSTKEKDVKESLLHVIDNIFSRKWNALFDDGISYSCYSLSFRDKLVRQRFKLVLDTLRQRLEVLIIKCQDKGILHLEDPASTADLIFVLADGAYYYLCLTNNKKEYETKLANYREQAIKLLNFT